MSESVNTFSNVQNLLKTYIFTPDNTIRNFQPKLLRRQIDVSSLQHLPNCPSSTILVSNRDPVSGEIIDFIEILNGSVEETAQNSTSLRRIPNPLDETIRGSIMNCPFWPAGFEKPKKEIESLEFGNFHLGGELLIKPPDFSRGFEFKDVSYSERINFIKDDLEINLLQSREFEKWLGNDEKEKYNIEDTLNSNIQNHDDSNDILYDNVTLNTPVLEISKLETKITKIQTQWAEIVDTSQPINDFEEKIPYPAKTWNFELDLFQKQAIYKLESHQYVFVAAHTSAGKTVVAEYAIALSKKHMTRAIYTSPIKALSNQKYRDFKKEFHDVGLITGDMQIEPLASCLIMTTEILRSMLYCGSDVTRDLEFVILDEVHYINDSERGHVWEEVLILLPEHVTVIMLSATVPNTIEFADWVGNIKQRKVYVITTRKRPVPLLHYIYLSQCGKTVKDKLCCIVDAESSFKSKNYSDCQHKLNLKIKENPKTFSKSKSEASIWHELIAYLKREHKLPVIIFVLSRKRCDDIAKLLTVDLNTNKERDELHRFFGQCLKKLKTPDQSLPQLLWMKDSLGRGIGVHHSGILPILKEIVEMCFQRGLVKALFATETFAMGINMPAKTVVFDSVDKYDGTGTRKLKPAEYIQMAGRAGRRGHDDNGTVIILCKNDKLPLDVDLKLMILGEPEKLQSKFVLRYAVLLTCLRTESVKVENIVTHSYLEYNSKQLIPAHEKQLEIAKEKYLKLKEIEDHLQPLCDFYNVAIQYLKNVETLMKKTLSHPKISKELIPGRVLIISHGVHYNKIAILLYMKAGTIKVLVLDHSHEKDSKTYKDEQKVDNTWNKLLSLAPQYKYFHPEGIGGHCVLDINSCDIIQITKTFVKIDADNIIQNWNQRQMERFKNCPPNQKVIQAVAELNTLNNIYISSSSSSLGNGLQYFSLMEYLDVECLDIIDNLNNLKNQLDNLLPYTNITNFENVFREVYERESLLQKISDLEWKKSWKSLSLYPDYCNRLNVLKEFGFINENEEVELKGKIACEIGQNEIILTELISNNIIHGLDTAEIAALLSGLVFQAQTNIKPKMTKKLKKAVQDMEEISKRIEECEKKYGIITVERRERLNFGLVEVVYEWAQNKPFAQIMQLTDIQEGIIVRCIQQLDEIVRDVKTAAKRIGDRTLESKMEEVSLAIKRDIVFAASLYTTLEVD